MATLSEIKNWFKTGLKPTQAQFWATWDSFFHKDDVIPQSSIQDLDSTLAAKAEKSQTDGHAADLDAHNLNARLSGKADAVHTHEIADVNGLQDALDAPSFDNTKIPLPAQLPASEEVVKLDQNGNSTTIPTYEFFKVDPTNTEYATIDELVNIGGHSIANGIIKGVQIMCPNINPPRIYVRYGDNETDWQVINLTIIPVS
ncbi:hypothetical protein GCM10007424_23910 [Flavobacterium suaedae]|uniref:Uncharacterized protein n=1 Tax=Flavobacterium suaedae TaxID=1767027 RepID=A0ABQ1K3U8_9FLAO|nr:hypothetical protein [Flavobacterium suaedae]GGB83109.1 hypothetical protein GCM10007424_23910 [Flavobacterium suaedae]